MKIFILNELLTREPSNVSDWLHLTCTSDDYSCALQLPYHVLCKSETFNTPSGDQNERKLKNYVIPPCNLLHIHVHVHVKLGNKMMSNDLTNNCTQLYMYISDQVCGEGWSTSSHASPVRILLPILFLNLRELSLWEPPGWGVGSCDGRRAGEVITRASECGDT